MNKLEFDGIASRFERRKESPQALGEWQRHRAADVQALIDELRERFKGEKQAGPTEAAEGPRFEDLPPAAGFGS